MSIRASKQSVYEGLRQPDLKNAMEEVYPAVQALYDSSDFVEGPKAFSEKRPPKWKAE
jgi:crotonobetainyl-CoA hydratase